MFGVGRSPIASALAKSGVIVRGGRDTDDVPHLHPKARKAAQEGSVAKGKDATVTADEEVALVARRRHDAGDIVGPVGIEPTTEGL